MEVARQELMPAVAFAMTPIAQSLTVTYNPHPLLPIDRVITPTAWQAGRTVREYLVASGVDIHREIVIRHNSRLLTVIEWDQVCPSAGDFVSVEGVVSGGGKGGSNPIAIVLSVVLMIVAPYLAPILAEAIGIAGVSIGGGLITGAGIAQAVITIAGNMVISALFRPSQASAASSVTGQGAAESPTYSLSGGSNRMRPYEPLAVVMGTHRIFPDYGAKPYTEYEGDDQYLYQVFNFGIGNLALSDLRIGETLLSSYSDVTITRAENGVLPGFFGNVDTSEGADLAYATGWVTRTSGIDTTKLAVDIGVSLFYANDSGGIDGRTVNLAIEYAVAGTGAWQTFFPGLGESTFYHPETHEITLWNAKTKPMRVTYSLDVPVGQYEVRVKRASPDETDIKATSAATWSVLRSYQSGIADYSNQTVLGIKIKASGQLNGALQQLSAVAVQSTPVWTGSAWVNQPTESPAWWALNFARGYKDAAGHLLYGLGMSDDQIDIDAIKAFAVFCATNGLTFNAVLDRQQNAAEVLNMICRCGFGSPSWASGKLGVVWDAPNQSPVMAFGMSNIAKGSFNVAYITENLADEIVATYVDRETWESSQIRVTVPGTEGTPIRPSTIEIMGCTDKVMAAKFANNIAAQQVYRRRMVTWETDFEGFVCQRGDVVLLQHDLTQWGYSGRIVSLDGLTLTLDRTVPRSGAAEYLMIQSPDGEMDQFVIPAGVGDDDAITLPSTFALQDGYSAVDHKWYFSPLSTPGKKVKIVSVKPLSETRVRLIATDEDPAYYAAWNGVFTAPTVQSLLKNSATVSNLTLKSHHIVIDNFQVNRATASWRQTGGTQHCTVRAWLDGVAINTWTMVTAAALDIDLAASTGTLSVEVTPFGAQGSGAPVSASLIMSALPAPSAPVVAASPALFAIDVRWLFGDTRQDIRYTELWFSTTNNRAAAVKINSEPFPGSQYQHIGMEPGDGGYYWARVFDTRGNQSEWSSGVNAGVYATVSTDPSDLLTQLQGALGMPQLAAELAEPIALITAPSSTPGSVAAQVAAETLARGSALSVIQNQINELASTPAYDSAETYVVGQSVTYSGGLYSAKSTTTGNLPTNAAYWNNLGNYTSLGDAVADAAAKIVQLNYVSTSSTSVLAQALATLQSTVASNAQTATAGQSSEATTRSNADGALAQRAAALEASVNSATTGLATKASIAYADAAKADAISASASSISYLQSQLNPGGTTHTAVATAQSTANTAVTAASAAVSTANDVQVRLSTGDFAAVKQQSSTTANRLGQVEAKWVMKTQTMADGVNAVAGIELVSGAGGSALAVLADKFLFYRPDGTGAPKPMMTMGTVNGVTALGLDGSGIFDGTVVARSIDSRGLAIRDASGRVILGSGTALNWSDISNINPNRVQSLPVWSYNAGAWLSTGTWIGAEDRNSLVFPANSGCNANSPWMALGGGTWTVSFMAYSPAPQGLSIDLFPDTLPGTHFDLAAGVHDYQATITSNHSDMNWCSLRFLSEGNAGGLIEIGNIKLEGGAVMTSWVPHRLDTVGVNNKITSANISTYIADLAVDTLQIAGNAVTVPIANWRNDNVYGVGQWQIVSEVSVPMSQAGAIFVTASMAQYYQSGNRLTYAGIGINGVIVFSSGGAAAMNMTPSLCGGGMVGPGTHTVQLFAWGEDASVHVADRSMIIQGVKR